MKLTKIIARGFKGRDFAIDLTPATVLYGRNFRGKTRVMDAIRLALLGYLPELGKRNQDTFGLATGPEMEVIAMFDNDLTIRRRWSLSGNSVKSENEVPEAIKEMGDLAVMLNAEEYFGLSDNARVNYVFAHCPVSSSMGADDVVSRVEKLLIKEFPGDDRKAVDKFVGRISAKQDDKAYPDCRAFMEEQIIAVGDLWKEAKAAAVRAEKSIQQTTDQRLRDEPSTPLAVLEETRAKLERQLADLNERKGRMIGSFSQMKTDRARREQITREIGFGDKTKLQLLELREKLRLLDEQIAGPRVTQADIAASSEAKNTQANLVLEVTRKIRDARTIIDRCEKELSELDGKTECPFCGAKGDGWKALKAAELAVTVDTAKALIVDAETLHAQLSAEVKVLVERHADLLNRQKVQIEEERARADVAAQIARLEPQIARLETLAEELPRLMADDPTLTAQVEALQGHINVANDDIRRIDNEIKVANGRAFELKRLADAEKDRDEAKLDAKVAETAGKELRVIQGELVASAFKPLLDRANSFFADVLLSPLAYNVNEGGEIGTWRDGIWIGHRTFSGTEKALTYAAIQAALAMSSPFKLMLLDELGRLDEHSVDRTVNLVCRAIDDGRLDGFVGIDVGRAKFYELHSSANPNLQVLEVK